MKLKKPSNKILLLILLLLLVFSFLLALAIGSVEISIIKSFSIIFKAIGFPVDPIWTPSEESIILQIRLPRAILAIIIGAMLSIAGVGSQNLFRNPIADPYIIGISSAAGFGAAIVMVLEIYFLQKFTIPLFSFIFGFLSVVLIYFIAKKRQDVAVYSLLLSGIAISYIFSALISFILFISTNKSHMILNVLLGHLWGVGWEEVIISTLILILCTVGMYFYGFDMNLLLFGDQSAQSMGVNVKKTKTIILICMTLLTATAVAFCGTIGFLGLIVPHITRILFGADNRKLVLFSGILGGILLLWADLIARSIAPPLEIPVGIFTSLMGGPFFIYLIVKNYKK